MATGTRAAAAGDADAGLRVKGLGAEREAPATSGGMGSSGGLVSENSLGAPFSLSRMGSLDSGFTKFIGSGPLFSQKSLEAAVQPLAGSLVGAGPSMGIFPPGILSPAGPSMNLSMLPSAPGDGIAQPRATRGGPARQESLGTSLLNAMAAEVAAGNTPLAQAPLPFSGPGAFEQYGGAEARVGAKRSRMARGSGREEAEEAGGSAREGRGGGGEDAEGDLSTPPKGRGGRKPIVRTKSGAEARREERRARNKESAKRHRDKKLNYTMMLEKVKFGRILTEEERDAEEKEAWQNNRDDWFLTH